MDVIEELKFLGKFTKKNSGGGGVVDFWGVRVDVNEELKFLFKFKKNKIFLGGGGGGGWGGFGGGESGWGSQDGCERRIEVFVKIQKKNWGGGGSGGGSGGGGSGLGGGGWAGVRVDVNEELKFL